LSRILSNCCILKKIEYIEKKKENKENKFDFDIWYWLEQLRDYRKNNSNYNNCSEKKKKKNSAKKKKQSLSKVVFS